MRTVYLSLITVILSFLLIPSMGFADSPAGDGRPNPDEITEAGTGKCPGGVNSCEIHRDPENAAINRMAEADRVGRVLDGKTKSGVGKSDGTQ